MSASTPTPAPNRRLGHKKSRNGCLRCKARRVKCDEQRPCSNCVRHSAACSLLDSPPQQVGAPGTARPLNARRRAQRVRPARPAAAGDALTTSPRVLVTSQYDSPGPAAHDVHPPGLTISAGWLQSFEQTPSQVAGSSPRTHDSPSHVPSQPFPADWLQSLRLMHHYCTSAAQVLSRDSATEELWRTAIPEAAASHEILMHGLLAVSALHYAHTHPSERGRYTLISAHHQNVLLPHFANRLSNIDEANCEAYFFLASMIFVLSLCWVAHHDTLHRDIAPRDVAQSFIFLQGARGILGFRPIQKWRESGPLSQMLRPATAAGAYPSAPPPPQGSRFLDRLDRVTALARRLPMAPEVINEQTACILAVEALRATYAACRGAAERPVSVWSWPIHLPDLFVEMVGGGHWMALVVLAHYAALARSYEDRTWASEGWSRGVVAMVEQTCRQQSISQQEGQDGDWLSWIEWPKRSILDEVDVDDMQDGG